MLRKYSRIFAVITVAVMISVLLAGCSGGGTIKKPEMKEGATAVTVTGSCDIKVENGVITVSGETNLLAGSIIYISVEAQNGLTLDSFKVTQGEDSKVSHDFTITDDKYDASVTSVVGHISCAPRLYGTQPTNVYGTYGDKFENIVSDGNIVWNTSGVTVVFASQIVDLNK